MRTYIADIIPRLQRFSEQLDNLTLLTNQHWVVVDEITKSKTVYIFRTTKELLISKNGEVERANWEYLGNKTLLINIGSRTYLFKQGFFDQNVLALKIDGKEEYAFLVNENKYDGELNSFDRIIDFLQKKYINASIKGAISSSGGQLTKENQKPVVIKTPKQLEKERIQNEKTLEQEKKRDRIFWGITLFLFILMLLIIFLALINKK